jgi:LuxR family maltose regulon positive regulatory protein
MSSPSPVIPRSTDAFIGRAAELQAVASLLAAHRLVTLTGGAGIGKSRLALRIAEERAAFSPDGVCFVGLVETRDPAQVARRVAAALGLREEPDRPLPQTLADALASRALLFVWDNCDHVVEACRALALSLLQECPQIRILATSRGSLHFPGETLYEVPPLGVPERDTSAPERTDPAELVEAHEGLQLFQQRAREKLPHFTITRDNLAAVAQIGRRLDGIALALELAAGRLRELSADQLAARLDERFSLLVGGSSTVTHQQTLRTAIGWSYDLLGEPERMLLARLSVFAGGWDLEAAEAVCSAHPEGRKQKAESSEDASLLPTAYCLLPTEVLGLLTRLIDRSWVVGEAGPQGQRYRLLESVRDFGRERPQEGKEAGEFRHRHAAYYLELAERAEPELAGPAQAAWLDWLEVDHDNLRAALAWYAEAEGGAEPGLRLAAALQPFWEIRGHLGEGTAAVARALRREGADRPTPARARALRAAGMLAAMQADHAAARAFLEESLAVQRASGDLRNLATTVHHLGQVLYAQGEYGAARARFEEGLALREQDDRAGIAWSVHELARVAQAQGDFETAGRFHQQSLALFRELGNRRGSAFALIDQGNLACAQGRFEAARPLFQESLAIFRATGNRVGIAIALNRLGKVARELGDPGKARELHAESLEIRRQLGDRVGVAWCLEAFARLAAPDAPRRAARLWGAAEALREALGAPLPPEEREECATWRAVVRSMLGEAPFAGAWAEGRALDLEQAVKFALQEGPEENARAGPAAIGSGGTAAGLLTGKLERPALRPTLVDRPRLTARLRPSGPARLALVVAPAGSGKSSLLGQWAQDPEAGPVAWLALDAEDSDPARFLPYLCAALETVAPAAVAPLRALLRSPQPPPLQPALTLLLNALAALEQPVTLVLDDYHVIESPAVHELVTFLVDHLPPTLFLILATRSDPPLPLARLRVRGWLAELRAEDLRFTSPEASQFLNESMQLALAPDVTAGLIERTEGWIAGLQLAALSLQGHPDPRQFVASFTGSHRFLVDYLFEEVLVRQPTEVQTFLYRTAILERLCGPLCEAVAGDPEPDRSPGWGQDMLVRLEAANLFMTPLDAERQWYRYHPLFAGVLRAGLLPEHGEEIASLHARASGWYAREGMHPEAVEHALAGGLFERAAELLEEQYAGRWLPPERTALERWLQALPAPLLRSRPHLCQALAGIHLAYYRAEEAARILDECPFEPEGDGPAARELQGKLLLTRAGAARLQGDREQAESLTRSALDLFAGGSPQFRSPALLHLGILREARGDLDAAERLFSAALTEAENGRSRNVRLRASYALGQLHEARGALREAVRCYAEALAYAEQQDYSHTAAAGLIYAGLGRISYRRNDLAGAAAYLAEGLARTESTPAAIAPMHAVPCLLALFQVHTARRETEAAAALLTRMEQAARATPVPCLDPLLGLLRARSKDEPSEVRGAWMVGFEGRAAGSDDLSVAIPDLCVPDIRSLVIATWAQARLARDPGEATGPVRTRLEEFLEALMRQGRHDAALEVRVLLARLHWEAGHRGQALAALEPALLLAGREGYARAFVAAGPSLVPLLQHAAAQGMVPAYVGTLLAAPGGAERAAGTPSGSQAAALVEPLSERELEVLRLLALGLSNKEIADQLFLSVGTVKQHLHHINGKLEATSRTSAVARARALGLL